MNWLRKIVYGMLPVSIFFLIGFMLVLYQPPNFDTFWHVKVGEWIVQHKAIPYEDTFSYFQGLKFMAHEWLFDILLYGLFSLGGIGIAKLFMSILFTITLLINLQTLRLRGVNKTFGVVFIAAAALLLYGYIQVRPQTVSLMLLSILVYTLEKNAVASKTGWKMIIIPLIFLLAANIHGGTLPMFIGVFGVYGLTELFVAIKKLKQGFTLPDALGKITAMFLFGVASLVASLINPYGLDIYQYAIKIMGNHNTTIIFEWQPLITRHSSPLSVIIALIPLVIMCLMRHRVQFRQVFLISLMTIMMLLQKRHFLIWAEFGMLFSAELFLVEATSLVQHPLVKNPLAEICKFFASTKQTVVVVLFGIMLLAIGANVISLDGYSEADAERKWLPVDALTFINEKNIDVNTDRMLAFYDWGGYLIYNNKKVFIDGRSDLYMNSFNPNTNVLDEYFSIDKYSPEKITAFLDKYNIEYILDKPANTLAFYADMSDDWDLIYCDNVSSLYKRK